MKRVTMLGGCLLALGAAPAAAASLTVSVDGIGSDQGTVFVTLCEGSLEERDCRIGATQPARDGTLLFRFPGLPEGPYAIAAFQDLNGNRRLDRDGMGLPLEPYGFSNEVGRTAPPSFERARILVRGDVSARIRLDRVPR